MSAAGATVLVRTEIRLAAAALRWICFHLCHRASDAAVVKTGELAPTAQQIGRDGIVENANAGYITVGGVESSGAFDGVYDFSEDQLPWPKAVPVPRLCRSATRAKPAAWLTSDGSRNSAGGFLNSTMFPITASSMHESW